MHPPTHKPTETTYERQELLRQEMHSRRWTRRRELAQRTSLRASRVWRC
jgi:hypothetical protein